jgi:hypothetical protein
MLAPPKVRTNRCFGDVRQNKSSQPYSFGINTAQSGARKTHVTSIDAACLLFDTKLERFWPSTIYKIVPMMEQKYAPIIEVGADPNRCMQRCAQTIAGLYRRNKALLECQRSDQP